MCKSQKCEIANRDKFGKSTVECPFWPVYLTYQRHKGSFYIGVDGVSFSLKSNDSTELRKYLDMICHGAKMLLMGFVNINCYLTTKSCK